MDKCDKRAAIMLAALELVAENGFHGAPMAMVAERAGVGAGTIYRYFASKDELIVASYADLEARMLAAIIEDYPAGSPARERFIHVAMVLTGYCIASPMEFKFLEQFHLSPYGAAHRRERLFGDTDKDMCTELFKEALESRTVKDLPLPVLFAVAFAPLLDVCRSHILGFLTLDDAMIRKTVEACWDGVKSGTSTVSAS